MITLMGCQYFYSGAVQHMVMEGSLAYHTHCFGVGRPVYMERTQDTWHWHKNRLVSCLTLLEEDVHWNSNFAI